MTTISVVIATYQRERLALESVASVLQSAAEAFEVIVVDQGRGSGLGDAVSARFPGDARLRYHRIPTIGLSHARNFGTQMSTAEVVIFLDDDAVAEAGWLEAYREAFDSALRPVMVGGRIVPEFEAPLPRWFPRTWRGMLGIYDAGPEMIPFPGGDLPVGANFAIRRADLLSIGGFDPGLGFNAGKRWPLGGEDSLVGLRVKQRGGLVLYQPGARVRHLVRRDKLRLGSFLRRAFTEGRTQVAIARRASGGPARHLRSATAWRASGVLRAPRVILSALRSGRPSFLEAGGELLASAAMALGNVAESWAGRRGAPVLARPVGHVGASDASSRP